MPNLIQISTVVRELTEFYHRDSAARCDPDKIRALARRLLGEETVQHLNLDVPFQDLTL